LGIWTNTFDETLAGTIKLRKAIEKPCNDVKVFRQTNG
jgi:hypothetical protein